MRQVTVPAEAVAAVCYALDVLEKTTALPCSCDAIPGGVCGTHLAKRELEEAVRRA